jgi:hypothetical protein
MSTIGKFLAVTLLALSAAACSPTYKDVKQDFPVLPMELKECTFYYLEGTNLSKLTVVKCPNSTVSTTYLSGKTNATVVVDAE